MTARLLDALADDARRRLPASRHRPRQHRHPRRRHAGAARLRRRAPGRRRDEPLAHRHRQGRLLAARAVLLRRPPAGTLVRHLCAGRHALPRRRRQGAGGSDAALRRGPHDLGGRGREGQVPAAPSLRRSTPASRSGTRSGRSRWPSCGRCCSGPNRCPQSGAGGRRDDKRCRTFQPSARGSRRNARWPAVAVLAAVLAGAYGAYEYGRWSASEAARSGSTATLPAADAQDAETAAAGGRGGGCPPAPDRDRRGKAAQGDGRCGRGRGAPQSEAQAEEKRRIAAARGSTPQGGGRSARRSAKRSAASRALEAARRAEEKRKEEERLRLAALPDDAARAEFVRRVQSVLKSSRCWEGAGNEWTRRRCPDRARPHSSTTAGNSGQPCQRASSSPRPPSAISRPGLRMPMPSKVRLACRQARTEKQRRRSASRSGSRGDGREGGLSVLGSRPAGARRQLPGLDVLQYLLHRRRRPQVHADARRAGVRVSPAQIPGDQKGPL